ncbi:MAG: hypothetical protein R3320_09250 [Nitriliruptorales bacterium]|nr:hypothetical protein [Nitriliruptorales bacterium]
MSDTMDEERSSRLDELRDRLREQADLFDDPGAYLAGVEDTFEELDERPRVHRTLAPGRTRATVEAAFATRADRARYIAALAVGLTTAGRPDAEVLEELVAEADRAPDLLQQAARCVYALRVGDTEHRRAAQSLLLRAVMETSPAGP